MAAANRAAVDAYEQPIQPPPPPLPSSPPGHIGLRDMLSMGYQVAKGMQYLSSRKCVHRDLAARNVLVSEDMTLKIADFGLARDVNTRDYYRKTTDGKLPVKWMAPESLFERVYTAQSDVWSFGILLWEIVTLGDSPYRGLPFEELCEWLRSGRRMERPPRCPEAVFEVMAACWRFSPADRPDWQRLVDWTHALYAAAQPNVYLDLSVSAYPAHSPTTTSPAFVAVDRNHTSFAF